MKVLGIVFYNRSGSMLVSSMLDSHPSILTLPPYILNGFYSFWRNEVEDQDSFSNVLNKFCYYFATLFDVYGGNSDLYSRIDAPQVMNLCSFNSGKGMTVSEKNFKESLSGFFLDFKERGFSNRASFLLSLHVSFENLYLGREWKSADDGLCACQLHSPDQVYLLDFLEDFPNAKILHVIRNPIISLGSHIKHYINEYGFNEEYLYGMLRQMLYSGTPINGDYDSIKGFKFEQLHAEPELTMRRVAEWLEIDWHPILLKSTFGGEPWVYINNGEKISGLGNVAANRSHNDFFSDHDKAVLSYLTRDKMLAWGYPYIEKKVELPDIFDFEKIVVGYRSARISNLIGFVKDNFDILPKPVRLI